MMRCECGRRSITWAPCEGREMCRACCKASTCHACHEALIDARHGEFVLAVIVFIIVCALAWALVAL